MYRGYIRLWRKIDDNPISLKPAYLSVFLWLVRNANNKDKRIIWNSKDTIVKRGSLITSLKKISKGTGVPRTTVERILNYLKNETMIGILNTNKFRLILVKNYDEYNPSGTVNGIQMGFKRDQTIMNNNDNNIHAANAAPNNKPMYNEPIIEIGEDGEPHPLLSKKQTYGQYPARLAKYYCELMNKRSASRQLPAAKELMQIAAADFPNDSLEDHYKEIIGRIDVAFKHYKGMKEKIDWNLSKVAENWNLILKDWSKKYV